MKRLRDFLAGLFSRIPPGEPSVEQQIKNPHAHDEYLMSKAQHEREKVRRRRAKWLSPLQEWDEE